MQNNNVVAHNIKELRILKKLTQLEVAEKIPCALKTYQNIERGRTHPDLPMLKQIAEALDTSLVDLLKGEIHIQHIEKIDVGINNKDVTINNNDTNDKLDRVLDILMADRQNMMALIERLVNK